MSSEQCSAMICTSGQVDVRYGGLAANKQTNWPALHFRFAYAIGQLCVCADRWSVTVQISCAAIRYRLTLRSLIYLLNELGHCVWLLFTQGTLVQLINMHPIKWVGCCGLPNPCPLRIVLPPTTKCDSLVTITKWSHRFGCSRNSGLLQSWLFIVHLASN